MSDLRTRIAVVIALADGDIPGMEPFSSDYALADAVIRELNLTQEWSIGNEEDGRVIWDNQQEAIDYQHRNDEPVQTRYVTQWGCTCDHCEYGNPNAPYCNRCGIPHFLGKCLRK